MSLEPDKVVALIEAVAAEEVTTRFRNLQEADITDKGGGDFVTRADEETERRLTDALRHLLPGSVVVGEEAAHADPSVVGRIAGDAPVWIIDPLDGTNNFAHGNEMFAVMAALTIKGQSVFGAIHMPMRGETVVAEKGSGAYLGTRRLRTAAPRTAESLRASVHTGYLPADIKPHVQRCARRYGSNEEIYCAGQVYAGLAKGEIDGALFWHTKPWDHAMGSLILAEAGGLTGYADGQPYRPTDRGRLGLIAASGPECWTILRDDLFPQR